MSMIRKLSPIAVAIAALMSAPAFAGTGASATALNGQLSSTGTMNDDTTNSATLSNHVLENATGNIGVNNAAGNNNQQANDTSIAKSSMGSAAAGAGTGQLMISGSVNVDDVTNNATLSNDVLENASGNINVNNAAGTGNQQGNSTAIAMSNDENAAASAGAGGLQEGLAFTTSQNATFNNAELENEVLQNATGKVGVNNAAGNDNQQENSLAIAVGDDGGSNAMALGLQANGTLSGAANGVANNAALENEVLQNASGDINVNNAAGTGNTQGNNLAMAVTDQGLATSVAASGQLGVGFSGTDEGVMNSASLSGHVLQNASGNIGVNNAAGMANQQMNQLSVAVSTNTAEQ